MGDFAVIGELPQLYRHCQATEDADIDVIDFVTEHLTSVGCVLDGLEQDEHEHDQPHVPLTASYQHIIAYRHSSMVRLPLTPLPPMARAVKYPPVSSKTLADYATEILRPPIDNQVGLI